jgi:glycerol-3-phosphate acyltransferase PlsX
LYGGGREVDVVVCDGFVGNIVLKATEGLAKSLFNILINQIRESSLAKTGAILLKPSLTSVKKRLDYAEYGGAFLLGVNGSCLIGHGSSGALAVKNAIRVIQSASRHNITDQIESNIKKYKF